MRSTLLTLLLLIGFAAHAAATHNWAGYHWARQSNPFTLKLADNVSSTWDPYLATTSSDWSVSTVLDTTVVASGKNAKRCRATSGQVEVCSAAYGKTGWLGVAQVWVSGLHIVQGTVKVNDTYFSTAAYNKPAWRNLVMCQEVGHTFGLDHQDENFSNGNLGTCMDYTNDPDGTLYGQLNNEHPNNHDYDELMTIYAHLDSTTTVSSASATSKLPPAMRDLDFSGPGQWGRLIATTRNGRTEMYELDFGGGNKIFTFVVVA